MPFRTPSLPCSASDDRDVWGAVLRHEHCILTGRTGTASPTSSCLISSHSMHYLGRTLRAGREQARLAVQSHTPQGVGRGRTIPAHSIAQSASEAILARYLALLATPGALRAFWTGRL
jgi:hypothetical protein